MKKVKVYETEHSSLNPDIKELMKQLDQKGVCFRFKLDDRLQERKMTVRKCAELTGLRLATISNITTGKKSSINLHHLLILMNALELKSIEELVDIYIPE